MVIPLAFTHPIRAEIEIEEFTRERFADNFDKEHSGIQCISVPLQMFIDGFGLYRNSYRSILGFYFTIGALTFQERLRKANVLPMTLGPHGQNFDDAVDALQILRPLEEGVLMDIGGKQCLICAFTLCYTGDMPQQQENAGFKTQRAELGCRFCFIKASERDNLEFDVKICGRYHHQTIAMRKEKDSLPMKIA